MLVFATSSSRKSFLKLYPNALKLFTVKSDLEKFTKKKPKNHSEEEDLLAKHQQVSQAMLSTSPKA